MNRNALIGLIVATCTFSQIAQADFTFYSSEPDACQQIAGHWTGTGSGENWLTGVCVYHGTGIASAPDVGGNFTIDVSADKESGSFICPAHSATKLVGVCLNGVVIFVTDYGNLVGEYANNKGHSKGTLTASPGMNVDVDIQFTRTE